MHTAAFGTHIMSSCDMSDERAYGITKALAENMEQLSVPIASLKGIEAADMAEDIGVPMHPGAEKYYREAGVLD